MPLTYTYTGTISLPIGTYLQDEKVVKVDSAYDPQYGVTGVCNVSPAGFMYYARHYKRYRVVSVKVKTQAYYIVGSGFNCPIVAGHYVENFPGVSAVDPNTSWMGLAKRGACAFLSDNIADRTKKIRSLYWSRNNVADAEYKDTSTLVNADPSIMSHLHYFVGTQSQQDVTTANHQVRFISTIRMYTQFIGAEPPEEQELVQIRGSIAKAEGEAEPKTAAME